MFAVVENDAACRQQMQEPSHRLSHHRHSGMALVAAPSDHEDLARPFDLLCSQPVLRPLDRVSGRRERRAKVQRSCRPETNLVEGVLERASNHASAQ